MLKGVKANDLIEAVRSVAAGGSFVSPNLTLRILANVKAREVANPLAGLTKQEERTLRLLAAGLSNREIGQKFGVAEKTIKFHVTGILEKLKVRNRVEAALIARREWGDGVHDPMRMENRTDEGSKRLKSTVNWETPGLVVELSLTEDDVMDHLVHDHRQTGWGVTGPAVGQVVRAGTIIVDRHQLWAVFGA